MTYATGPREGRRPERRRTRRGLGTSLVAALALGVGAGVASAGSAGAAPACPPGTVAVAHTCFPLRMPTTTSTSTTSTSTVPPPASAPVTLPPVTVPAAVAPSSPVAVAEAARRLLELANDDRRRAGLGPLRPREDLQAIALEHSRTMARAGDIFHSESFFSAAVKRLLDASLRGENVAYNTNVDDTHTRLMASPGHRANLMNPRFTTAGFAVVLSPDGRYFTTQNFIQPAGAPPAASVPKAAPKPAPGRAPKPVAAPAPAPPTTVAPPPTTVAAATPVPAPLPPTTLPAPAPARLETTSKVLAAGSEDPTVPRPLGLAALVVLGAAGTGSLVVARRRGA